MMRIIILLLILFKQNILAASTTLEINPSEIVTLHFTSDNRVPYKVGVPFISYGTFAEAVQGYLIEPTDSHLSKFESNLSALEFAEPQIGNPSLIRLKLKENLYFFDGEKRWEATAEDLKFSIARFFFSKFNINAKHNLMNIVDSDKVSYGSEYKSELFNSIKVLNKYELTIQLKLPDPQFIEKLSHAGTPLVSKETLKDNYFSWKKWPVGVGNYYVIYSDLNSGETIIKKRDDSKFPNAINYIKFLSSKDNEGDIFWKDMWQLDSKIFKMKILNVSYGTLAIFFNYDSLLGNNENFRKAISYAIDRNQLVKNLNYLQKNSEIIPLSVWGRSKLEKKINLKLAKKYINKVPKKLIQNTIYINTFGQNNESIEKSNFISLKNQLEKLGLKIEFKLDDGKLKLDSPMYLVGIQATHKDPSYIFGYFIEGSFYQNGYPKNDVFIEKNYTQYLNSNNNNEKFKISKKLSSYLTNEAIVIPLWDLYSVYTYNSKKIDSTSITMQPGGMRFKVWDIKLNNE